MIGRSLTHYEITAKLGEGGMGEVWRATDTRLDREVALKVLPAEMAADPERLERFKREAKAIAALNHPNIVTIYSVEEAEGVNLLTMELIGRGDGDRILGFLHEGGERRFTWALYDLGSKVYQPLAGADTLDDLVPLGIGDFYLGVRDQSLVLYDDRQGEVRELLSVAPAFPESIQVAPDRRTIYFLRSSATSDIHLLEAIE